MAVKTTARIVRQRAKLVHRCCGGRPKLMAEVSRHPRRSSRESHPVVLYFRCKHCEQVRVIER
jgi:hypothetical protein